MLKLLISVWFWLVVLVSPIFASGFQLKAIGAMDVTGTMSKEWWYTSANPSLSGITAAGSAVTVTIDSVDYQAAVDGSGNWSYNPTTLAEGDHSVTLSSAAGSQSFTLHIGAVPENVAAPTQPETPVAGSAAQTLAVWLGGLLVVAAGVVLLPAKK